MSETKSAEEVLDNLSHDGPTATEILAALEAAGYVVVPREPTEEMIDAMGRLYEPIPEGQRARTRQMYGNMLEARPK